MSTTTADVITIDTERRSRTAWHEAGHVCAAYWRGLPTNGATVEATALTSGRAFVGRDIEEALLIAAEARVLAQAVPLRARRLLESMAIMTCAGELATDRAIALGLV